MFRRFWKWLQHFSFITSLPRTIGEAVAMVAVIGLAIKQWAQELDQTQLILILLALFGLIVVGITYLVEWRKKKSVKYIPELLSQMDEKVKLLIELSPFPQDKAKGFVNDVAELFDIDIQRFKDAWETHNLAEMKATIKEETDKFSKAHQIPRSSLQPFTIMADLLRNLSGLMDSHEIGLNSIKDNEYKKLEVKLEMLKHRLRDSTAIKRVNNYLFWWEGLTSFLLLNHYALPYRVDLLPVKVKAVLPALQPLIQAAVDEYMGYIKDSVYDNKEKE